MKLLSCAVNKGTFLKIKKKGKKKEISSLKIPREGWGEK